MPDWQGCEVYKASGYKWIGEAAVSGFEPAQNLLAQTALTELEQSFDQSVAAKAWLEGTAQSGNFVSIFLLACELSTSTIVADRDGQRAIKVLETEPITYFVDVRIVQTRAAVLSSVVILRAPSAFRKKP